MKTIIRHWTFAKSILLVGVSAVAGTAFMVHLDAFDQFYQHSRQFEHFDYDEIVIFMVLFLLLGLLCLSFRLYQIALAECTPHTKIDDLLSRHRQAHHDPSQRQPSTLTAYSHKSPVLLIVSLIILIGVVEILDMAVLHLLMPLPFHWEVLADATILILIISPAMYFLFFRPMQRQFIIREQTENALQQCNLELEDRVLKRTAELENECAERRAAEEMLRSNQQQLRTLSLDLAHAEERERRRIAAELHDNVGHCLALAKNKLGMFDRSTLTATHKVLLEDITDLVETSIGFSRTLIFDLSSPLLEFLSLQSAIEWLSEDVLKSNNINARLEIEDVPVMLSDDCRISVLKAVRELMVNVVKHAGAENVLITLRASAGELLLEIKDDGVGFQVPDEFPMMSGLQGLGLFGVYERLAAINGRFSIHSAPGQGTSCLLTIPLDVGPAKEEGR